MKPTQILSKLCKDAKIDGPMYSHGKVTIGRKAFSLSNEEMEYYVHAKGKYNNSTHRPSMYVYVVHLGNCFVLFLRYRGTSCFGCSSSVAYLPKGWLRSDPRACGNAATL